MRGSKRAAVAWTKLRHARGSAKNVPELLAHLPDVEKRKRAFEDLTAAFLKEREAFTASGAMFCALVDLAVEKHTEHGEELLSFALTILALGDVRSLQARGLAPNDKQVRRRYAKPLAKALVREAHESVPALKRALDDARPPIRAMAAMLLGVLVDEAASSAPNLVARIASENDSDARAAMIFAAMHLARASSEAASVVRPCLTKLAKHRDPLARGASLIALRTIDGRWPDVAKAREDLVAFFAAAIPLTFAPHASDDRNAGSFALRVLDEGAACNDAHLEAALAALEAMRAALPLPEDAFIRFRWTTPILDRWFPPRRGGHHAHINNPVDVAKLDEDARRILVALSKIRPHGGNYAHAGLPPDLRSRRRLLGLEPPSLMDDVVAKSKLTSAPMPRWRIVRLAMDKHDKLKSETAPPLHTFAKANTFELEPKQWLEIWAEVHAEAHGLYTYVDPDPLVTAFADASATDLRAWATRYLDEIVGHSTPKRPFPLGPDAEMRSHLGNTAVLGLIRAKAPIPERYDAALTLFSQPPELREIFEGIPHVRRAGVVASIFEYTRSGRNKGNFDHSKVARLLDLMPEAAPFVLQRYQTLKDFENSEEIRAIIRGLEKREPSVRAALKEAMRAWKAPKPKLKKSKPKPKSKPKKAKTPRTYRFIAGQEFDLEAAEALTGVARDQFLYAAERYGGGPYKTPREFFVWSGGELGEAPEETSGATHWKIERTAEKGKTVYEMWVFMADNGTVFEAGTSNDTCVHMVQGGFQSLLDTPETNELADDLQEVVPF